MVSEQWYLGTSRFALAPPAVDPPQPEGGHLGRLPEGESPQIFQRQLPTNLANFISVTLSHFINRKPRREQGAVRTAGIGKPQNFSSSR